MQESYPAEDLLVNTIEAMDVIATPPLSKIATTEVVVVSTIVTIVTNALAMMIVMHQTAVITAEMIITMILAVKGSESVY
jgi:hypothetical protein